MISRLYVWLLKPVRAELDRRNRLLSEQNALIDHQNYILSSAIVSHEWLKLINRSKMGQTRIYDLPLK